MSNQATDVGRSLQVLGYLQEVEPVRDIRQPLDSGRPLISDGYHFGPYPADNPPNLPSNEVVRRITACNELVRSYERVGRLVRGAQSARSTLRWILGGTSAVTLAYAAYKKDTSVGVLSGVFAVSVVGIDLFQGHVIRMLQKIRPSIYATYINMCTEEPAKSPVAAGDSSGYVAAVNLPAPLESEMPQDFTPALFPIARKPEDSPFAIRIPLPFLDFSQALTLTGTAAILVLGAMVLLAPVGA